MNPSTILKNLGIFFSFLLALGFIYSPALVGYHVHHDDYWIWGWDRAGIRSFPAFGALTFSGRFLAAVLQGVYFSIVETVFDLNKLRMINLVYLSLCSFGCFWLLRRKFLNDLNAFLFTIMVFALPTFQVTVSGAYTILVATGILMAGLAGFIVVARLMDRSFRQIIKSSTLYLCLGLLIGSLMIYQPAGMLFWVVGVLAFLNLREEPMKRLRSPAFNFFGIGAAAMVIYFIILFLYKALWGKGQHCDYGAYDPFNFVLSPIGKLSWFFCGPLVNALNLWNVFPTITQTVLTFTFIGLTYAVFILRCLFYERHLSRREQIKRILGAVLIPSALVFLSYLPNLLSGYDRPWYQCSLALSPIVLLGLLVALRYWIAFFPQPLQRRVLTSILIIGCLTAGYKANTNIYKYRVLPDRLELEFVKTKLWEVDLSKYKAFMVKLAAPDIFAPHAHYHEFGTPSSSVGFHVFEILRCALAEIGIQSSLVKGHPSVIELAKPYRGSRPHAYYTVTLKEKEEPLTVEEETLVIDMNSLKLWTEGRGMP